MVIRLHRMAYMLEVAYPITFIAGRICCEWSANGLKKHFGEQVKVIEMQSGRCNRTARNVADRFALYITTSQDCS